MNHYYNQSNASGQSARRRISHRPAFNRMIAGMAALACASMLSACSALQGDGDSSDDALLLGLAALATAPQNLALRFEAVSGSQSVSCTSSFTGNLGGSVGTRTMNLNDLRFYVSNIRLLSGETEIPVTIPSDGVWQTTGAALVDLEDGSNGCATTGTTATNNTVNVVAPTGVSATGVVFDLGLPDSLNQLENGTAPSPLNLNALYWSWAIGYKFTRIEFTDAGAAFKTQIHLGALECGGDISQNSCAKPYRSSVRLTQSSGFNPATTSIALDFETMLASFDAFTGTRRGCMPEQPPAAGSATAEETANCPNLLGNFGLQAGTGVATGTQQAFKLQ